jgi:hypothetical protein
LNDIHTALAGMSTSVAVLRCPTAVNNEKSYSRKPNPVFCVDVIFVNTITADESTIGDVLLVFVTEDTKYGHVKIYSDINLL